MSAAKDQSLREYIRRTRPTFSESTVEQIAATVEFMDDDEVGAWTLEDCVRIAIKRNIEWREEGK